MGGGIKDDEFMFNVRQFNCTRWNYFAIFTNYYFIFSTKSQSCRKVNMIKRHQIIFSSTPFVNKISHILRMLNCKIRFMLFIKPLYRVGFGIKLFYRFIKLSIIFWNSKSENPSTDIDWHANKKKKNLETGFIKQVLT